MNKSVQFRDLLTQKWLEKRKECVPTQIVTISRASTSAACSTRSVGLNAGGAATASKVRYQRARAKPYRIPPVHVKLAEDNAPTEQSESDSSAYDSINEAETDFCRDESDYSDDYETEGFATMDVFEYEVDELSDSEDLESNGSSGTDDMVADIVARAIFASSSSEDDDDDEDSFDIFNMDADTEESDAPTDPELGRHDFWTCMKCKNQKNNPMYRFCEKCYQIRKTHFPPRPKHRRKRANLKDRNNGKSFSSPSSRSSASTIDDKNNDDSDGSSSEIGNKFHKECNQVRVPRRRSTSLKQLQNQNSAGESSCGSSQELSPDDQQSTTAAKFLRAASPSGHKNGFNIEPCVNVNKQNSNLSLFEHNYPNSQESVYPNSESFSQTCSSQDVICEKAHLVGKFDSQSSTSSGCYSMDLPSSSSFAECHSPKQCDANANRCKNLIAMSSSDSTYGGDMMTTETSTMISMTKMTDEMSETSPMRPKRGKKRKVDFSDEAGNSDIDDEHLMAKKFHAKDSEPDATDTSNGMCMICLTEPKNGAFVHNRFLHVCCCYRCTVKVWNKRKRCPICNSQVKTVLKMFVH